MKILSRRVVASAVGAAALAGLAWAGSGSRPAVAQGMGSVGGPLPARGQAQAPAAAQAPAPAPAPAARPGAGARGGAAGQAWTAVRVPPQQFIPPGGMWAEVIHSTSRWVVVQNQDGQQFPIAGDRIRQFLVRWPSSVNDLTQTSLVEATGMQANGGPLMVDHIDVYEADAQSLVTPTMQNLSWLQQPQGQGQGQQIQPGQSNQQLAQQQAAQQSPPPMSFDAFTQGSFGITNFMNPGTYNGGPSVLHVVGRPAGINPLQLTGFSQMPGGGGTANGGGMAITVAPSQGGMSVAQVTLGTNSYAKKGDLVHLVPEAAPPRSLDVAQMVLYKKIPLRQFQP